MVDLPTVAESGVPEFAMGTWNSVVVPAGVPTDVITKIHGAVVKTLTTPEIRTRLANQGIMVDTNTPQEFAALIQKEYAVYAKLIKTIGLKSE